MTDQPAVPDPAAGESGGSVDAPCEDCSPVTERAVLFAFAFAVFAAWVAADFATGGKLTAWAAGTLAALRSRGGQPE